jgi:hypothetical protein
MDSAAELELVVAAFGPLLASVRVEEASTCCVLLYPRECGSPPAGDWRVIADAYRGKQTSSAPYVLELPDSVAAILYCGARTKAFLPPGVDRHWQARNFNAAGKGRGLSDLVKRHGRSLDSSAGHLPRVYAAAQVHEVDAVSASPTPTLPSVRVMLQRVADAEAAAHAAEVRAAAVEEKCIAEAFHLLQRVVDAESAALAAVARVASVEERSREADAALLRLRAELQFVRATANAALAAAQKRGGSVVEMYPRS